MCQQLRCRRLPQSANKSKHTVLKTLLLVAAIVVPQANSWILPRHSPGLSLPRRTIFHDKEGFVPRANVKLCASEKEEQEKSSVENKNNDNNKGGPLGFLFNPYESRIPPELKDEIYSAEANTPAARDRGKRVAIYTLICVLGILMAFFNALLTEIRNAPLPSGMEAGSDPLTVTGFDWVNANFLAHFLFTNKIGGGLCLLFGAGSGLLAEAELDTKRINAEKIFEELEKRKLSQKQKSTTGKSKGGGANSKKVKKRRSGKEQKRLQALSEIVELEQETESQSPTTTAASKEGSVVETEKAPSEAASNGSETEDNSLKDKDEGLFGKIKGFYEKADAMAAAQARLLNKELEDKGLVEKITDDSGFKVIGREEAAKIATEKEKESTKQTEVTDMEGSKKEN